jgi:hypothetical protein
VVKRQKEPPSLPSGAQPPFPRFLRTVTIPSTMSPSAPSPPSSPELQTVDVPRPNPSTSPRRSKTPLADTFNSIQDLHQTLSKGIKKTLSGAAAGELPMGIEIKWVKVHLRSKGGGEDEAADIPIRLAMDRFAPLKGQPLISLVSF